MTDAAYMAKNWLMRAEELEEQRKKQFSKVMLIESKVNNCVSHYETSGRRDLISAQASREDLLADYAMEREKLEVITNQVLHEDNITLKAIDLIPNGTYRALLISRHITRNTMKQIEKSGALNIKISQLFNIYEKALQELARILEHNKPLEIIPNETPKAEQITIINAAPA